MITQISVSVKLDNKKEKKVIKKYDQDPKWICTEIGGSTTKFERSLSPCESEAKYWEEDEIYKAKD